MTLLGMRRMFFRGGAVSAAVGLLGALAVAAGPGAAFASQKASADRQLRSHIA